MKKIERAYEPKHPQPLLGRELSPREKQVLILTALGLTTKQMALCMNIADQTIKNFLWEARAKLGALNGPNAVFIAMQNGII